MDYCDEPHSIHDVLIIMRKNEKDANVWNDRKENYYEGNTG